MRKWTRRVPSIDATRYRTRTPTSTTYAVSTVPISCSNTLLQRTDSFVKWRTTARESIGGATARYDVTGRVWLDSMGGRNRVRYRGMARTSQERGEIETSTVWGKYGAPGNGKTVSLMEEIEAWAKYRRTTMGVKLETGLPIYGNLDVYNEVLVPDKTYAPYHKITCDQFITLDPNPDLVKCGVPPDDFKTRALVVISEPHAWAMDSRTGGAEFSRQMAIKGTQARHWKLDIEYDTQIPSEIDKRFRLLCKVTELALEPIENSQGDPVRFRYAYFGRYTQKLLGIDRRRNVAVVQDVRHRTAYRGRVFTGVPRLA